MWLNITFTTHEWLFVELRAEEKIGKFGFTSLGIVEVVLRTGVNKVVMCIYVVEKRSILTGDRTQGKTAPSAHGCKSVSQRYQFPYNFDLLFFVRHFDQGGFSTLPVKDTKMKMLEIFEKVIKKRLLHKGASTSMHAYTQREGYCIICVTP